MFINNHCFRRRRRQACGISLLIWLQSLCSTALAGALSYQDALAIALRGAPALTATAAQEKAARSAAIPAGELPDPSIAFGIDNLPINGVDRYSLSNDFMTMRRIGVMQEFPNRAKRDARIQAAQAGVDDAQARTRIVRLTVMRNTAIAWINRYTAEQQLTRIPALKSQSQLLQAAVSSSLAAGQGVAADVVVPRQEAAMIDARADGLEELRAQAIAELRLWIGSAADAPLAGTPPDWPIARERLLEGLHRHPEIGELEAKQRAMDAEVAAARANKKPDWAMGLAYQQRGAPYSDMMSLEMRFDLPVFTRSRQNPVIAARLAERASLDAEREATLREHTAALEADLATYERVVKACERQRSTMLPLAEEKASLSMAAWRSGRGSLSDVVNARRERIEAELQSIELDGQRLQIAARLHYAYEESPGEQP